MARDDHQATQQDEARFARRDADAEAGADRRSAPDEPTDLPKRSLVRRPQAHRQGVRRRQPRRLGRGADLLRASCRSSRRCSCWCRCSASPASRRRRRSSTTSAQLAPGPATEIVRSAIRTCSATRAPPASLFFIGLAGAIWSASGYVGAFMRAANAIWDVEEGRPVWKTIPLRVAVTVVTLVLVTISALAVVLTGPLAQDGRQHRRPRRHGRAGLGHRQVAGARAHRELHVRAALLRGAERQAPEVPVGQPGRTARRRPVDHRLGRCSRSTWRTSPPTTRPTAASAASSSSSSGCGSRTS